MRSASCCILLLRVHCRPLQVVLIIHSASLRWAGVLSKPRRAQNYRGNVEKWHEMARWTGDPRSMIITRHNKQNKGWQKTNISSNCIEDIQGLHAYRMEPSSGRRRLASQAAGAIGSSFASGAKASNGNTDCSCAASSSDLKTNSLYSHTQTFHDFSGSGS